jgi:DNA-binding Lrp family transcriptional regulator
MGKLTRKKRLENYFRIYGALHTDYTLPVYQLAKNTGLNRTTVSKYLKEMRKKDILVGPYLEVKSSKSYTEYMYFMNFQNPQNVFEYLKEFPRVVYHALAAGDWNTLVISVIPLNFSRLVGFKDMVYTGVKYGMDTPKIKFKEWSTCFDAVNNTLEKFSPGSPCKNRELGPELEWGTRGWKLFSAFWKNPRKKKFLVLQNLDIRYEEYSLWVDSVKEYCSVNIRFYPQGYDHYVHQWILLDSQYEDQVKKVFSLFPSTPVIFQVGDRLLVEVAVITEVVTNMVCSLLDMQTVGMVKSLQSAQILKGFEHGYDIII